jgi:hypothetical protein
LGGFSGVVVTADAVIGALVAAVRPPMVVIGIRHGVMVAMMVGVVIMVVVEGHRAGQGVGRVLDAERVLDPVDIRHSGLMSQHRHQRQAAHGEEGSQPRLTAVEH